MLNLCCDFRYQFVAQLDFLYIHVKTLLWNHFFVKFDFRKYVTWIAVLNSVFVEKDGGFEKINNNDQDLSKR